MQAAPPPSHAPARTEVGVNTDFAELVLDDGDAAALLLAQDAVDEGRLAGAEEAWRGCGARGGGEGMGRRRAKKKKHAAA